MSSAPPATPRPQGARVEPGEHALACDLCGARTPFEPLPPLLFLTGASGAGKTTLTRALTGTVTEAILIDADLLWGVNPAHDDPASGYRQFRGLTLHLAERIARNGHPVVIEGTCIPEQYESLGERWYFTRTAYLAVTCAEDELRRRLARRPALAAGTRAPRAPHRPSTSASAPRRPASARRSRSSTPPAGPSPTAPPRLMPGSGKI